MRPLIGIPLCLDDRGRWRRGRDYQYIDAAYARAVSDAGGVPLYLPLQAETEALLEPLQGLLLPGGDDLPPPRPYPAAVAFDLAPEAQVGFDRALLGGALARGLPVLGICYGMQLLADALGGTLLYDIPTDLPGAGCHKLEDGGRHALRIEPGTRLHAAIGPAPGPVNSIHHQAIADAGPALRVSAHAGDGVAEAVEAPEDAFRVGVQWHPEKLSGPHRDGLFGAFVAACRDARRN